MLLEKAYAKAYSSYSNIIGGVAWEAIRDLTGAPGKNYSHKDGKVKLEQLWALLVDADRDHFMMTCGTDASPTGIKK